MPASCAPPKILKLLGEHIAAFEVGNHQDVGLAGNRRNQLLDLRRLLR